ncbi:TIR domain-containing protein [Chryseobacterium daecheongense]|uniref:Uncharacterized protein n=1 Tax=Chryseobacterium daecheongense TaxID=192389 RepID=A0A3N0VZ53_9FLAO|nr:hypothetical protein [Chryseobacterium daecheongense]ROH98096.1 hypothetical protein EGI05_12210 [Chryseobacterium daecheongense]TDX92704.1 hypothetical protein BCF50_1644 [Chryseobacterium daecheongense]
MKHKLNCYISAPANFDLTRLESLLNSQKIEYHSFYDFSIGTTFSDLIRRKIRESDFVIAVLQSENSNVLFELGVAEGLKKPTFILVDKEYKVPFFLDTKFYYQTNFKDLSLIELALKNFVQDIGSRKKNILKKEEKDTLSVDETTNTLARISNLRKNPNEREIFSLIKDTFSRIDIQNVSISESTVDKGVDLIIRSKNLTPYFGNPIFVEVKTGNLNAQRILQAEQQLLKYLNHSEAKGAIILYLDRDNKRFENIKTIYNSILLFDLEDFINGIASDGFEKTLIDKRNKSVHGNF